jgi:hypothetical protein
MAIRQKYYIFPFFAIRSKIVFSTDYPQCNPIFFALTADLFGCIDCIIQKTRIAENVPVFDENITVLAENVSVQCMLGGARGWINELAGEKCELGGCN